MNRSQSLLARIAACTIALLVSARALADVTLSVVDATPTAFHDGTLPGIGETIFSADVFVDVTPDEHWFSGGLGLGPGSPEPGVTLYYSRDPNTGDVRLTAPGNANDAEAFGTFVSFPFGQTQNARFRREAQFNGGYWGAPAPQAEPTILEVSYLEFPPSLTFGSGFTQRVTIDVSGSVYAGRDVYVSSTGPMGTQHVRLGRFESAALGTPSGQLETIRWAFFAVPEPASLVLLCFGVAVLCRRTRFGATCGAKAFVLMLSATAAAPMNPVEAQTPLLGSQVRIDESGPRGVSELAIASSDAAPDEIVAVWHDYTTLESTSRKLGVGVSLDGGRTWTTDLLPRGIDDDLDCTQAIDPFAFADARTGRLWVAPRPAAVPADESCWRLSSRGLRVWAPRSGIGFSCRNQSSEAPIMR
jgi:hypothetical protein